MASSTANDFGSGSVSNAPTGKGRGGFGAKKIGMPGFGKKSQIGAGAGKLGKSSKLAESISRLRSKGALA